MKLYSLVSPRSVLFFTLSAALGGGCVQAQQTIPYNNGDDNTFPIVITPALSPTELTITSGTATQSGVISASGFSPGFAAQVVKTGGGTLIFNAINTYAGDTQVTGGTLQIGTASTVGSIQGGDGGPNQAGLTGVNVQSGGMLVIAAQGTVAGGTGSSSATFGAGGGFGVYIHSGGDFSNLGTVYGGNGGSGDSSSGGVGAAGLYIDAAGTFSNQGTVYGGNGGVSTNSFAGSGSDAMDMYGAGSFTNFGNLIGGNGAPGGANGGAGAGLYALINFDNQGSITGGNGSSNSGTFGGSGNAAIYVSNGGTVTNEGTVTGGNGASGLVFGGSGGSGIYYASGGTFDNTATGIISGGTGAAGGTFNGSNGNGVDFGNGIGILINRGTINGTVYMNDYANQATLFSGGVIDGDLNMSTNTATTLTLDGTGTQIYSSAVTGTTTFSGTLVKQGSGTWTLDQPMSYTGPTIISAGTLSVTDGDISSSSGVNLTVSGAVFDIADAGGSATIQDLTGVAGTTVKLGFGTLIVGTERSTTFAGVIEDDDMGDLFKIGTGTLTLTGVNTYRCSTIINEGTLAIGAGGSIATSCEVDLTEGATFDISAGGNQTIQDLFSASGGLIELGANNLTLGTANSFVYYGDIEGTGGVIKQGEGTTSLDGLLSYTGATQVNEGTWQADGDNTFAAGSAHTVASGATIDLNDRPQVIGSLAGAGAVTLGSGRLTTGGNNTSTTFSGVISGTGGVTKTGTGTFTVTGVNTYGGSTIIAQGTLQLGAANAIPAASAIKLTGGTLNLNGFTPAAFISPLAVDGAGSTLDFGLGHVGSVTAVFGDSSGTTWTFDLQLIDFTVGTDALGFTLPDGLTSTQLGQIELTGYTAVGLDANGFVQFESSAVPEPTVALVLPVVLALLTFSFWQRRRQA